MRTYETCCLKDKEEIDMIVRWANRERDALEEDVKNGLMQEEEKEREMDELRKIVKKAIFNILM